jgi:hypothetical protein
MQFPNTLKKIPSLRIYYGGHKITGEPNNRTKQLIFSIPEIGESKKFHIVITEHVQFELAEGSSNTVKYLKIAENQPYKCCEIEQTKSDETLSTHRPQTGEFDSARVVIPETKTSYHWKITKQRLDDNRQLPDNSIVICFSPEYIQDIVGGSKGELPRIVIKSDILELVGSEEKLHDQETELLLSVINSDALHTKITQKVKNQNTKTIIACKTCI